MNGRSAGGLVLLLIGSLALIGYLTGNLDRWLGYLFAPPGTAVSTSTSSSATGLSAPALSFASPPGGNYRGAGA